MDDRIALYRERMRDLEHERFIRNWFLYVVFQIMYNYNE